MRFPVVVLSLLLAAPALAQTPDSVRAATVVVDMLNPPAAAKANVERQLKEMRDGNAIRAMLSQNPQFRAEAAKNQPSFNAALARMGAIQADAVGPILREMNPAGRQIAIDTYAKAFTAAELDAIAAFYRTPAGAKQLKMQGQISTEVGRQVQAKFGPRMVAAQKATAPKIEAELQKLFPNAPKGK
jgi:hypothetical protein